MKIDVAAVRECLKSYDFETLFREHLGWDSHPSRLHVPVDGETVTLTAVARKRGFVAFVCASIPERPVRLEIDHQVSRVRAARADRAGSENHDIVGDSGVSKSRHYERPLFPFK